MSAPSSSGNASPAGSHGGGGGLGVLELTMLALLAALGTFRARQVAEKIWLVSFMRYDLGFFDHETCRIESAANPFAARLSPMSPV
ncbi:MAG TPA: hypothetical protein VIH60_00490 [Steroidobacteraceae bacterium]